METEASRKKDLNYKLFLMLIILCYCNTYVMREILTNRFGIELRHSFITLAIMIVYITYNIKKNAKYKLIYLTIYILGFSIFSLYIYDINFKTELKFISTVYLPLLILTIEIDKVNIVGIFKKYILILNLLIVFNLFYTVIDLVAFPKLQIVLSQLRGVNVYKDLIGIYRSFTLLGHPLTNSLHYLIFYSSNMILRKYLNQYGGLPIWVIYLITILGMIFSNSKFALIIMCVMFIVTTAQVEKKKRYLFSILLTLVIGLNSSLIMDPIIGRFNEAIARGDITNGRIRAWNTLQNSGNANFNFFIGFGMGTSEKLLNEELNSNSLEVPVVMFAYDIGIASTVIIYLILLVIPICTFLKNKHYSICMSFSFVLIFANSYNGLAVGIGVFSIVAIYAALLVNLSRYLVNKEN